jgi:general secretion pathway protein I
MKTIRTQGFTLIEVLLALSILAIALTALIKASTAAIVGTQHVQQKNIGHLVATQAIARIQLGLIPVARNQIITETMPFLGVQWRWQAQIQPTGIEQVDQIIVTTSPQPHGAFHDPLLAFRVAP